MKPQWLLSPGTDLKWSALRLGLGILCMISNSILCSLRAFLKDIVH